MKIGDAVFVRGEVDEIRQGVVIIRNDGGYFGTVESDIVEDLPKRKTGRWIRRPYDGIYCTACGKGWSFMLGAPGDVEENYRYCPHCGTRMEDETDG